jgi:hypothetical protein
MEFKKLTLEDYARSSKEVSGYASIPTYGPLTAIHRCNNTEAEYLFQELRRIYGMDKYDELDESCKNIIYSNGTGLSIKQDIKRTS